MNNSIPHGNFLIREGFFRSKRRFISITEVREEKAPHKIRKIVMRLL